MCFSLASIDAYCLGIIIKHYGVSKILMYQCGDTTLNRKLLTATREMTLYSGKKYALLNLPSLLSRFYNLRKLKIKHNAVYINEHQWLNILSALPKSLTCLDYDHDFDGISFVSHLSNLTTLIMRRTNISRAHVERFPATLTNVRVQNLTPDFRGFPPNVKIVKIYGEPTRVALGLLEGITDLHLDLVHNHYDEPEPLIGKLPIMLPKSIERVYSKQALLGASIESAEVIDTLRLYFHPGQVGMVAQISSDTKVLLQRLPTNITDLDLYSNTFGQYSSDDDSEDGIDTNPIIDLTSLSHLKKLNVSSGLNVMYPTNLTHLKIAPALPIVPAWPQNLTKLRMRSSVPLKEVPPFPASLKKLCFRMYEEMQDLSMRGKLPFTSLPQGLVSLELAMPTSMGVVMSSFNAMLPLTLEKLCIHNASVGDTGQSFFFNLPPKLKQLSLISVIWRWPRPLITANDMMLLPTSLKRLKSKHFDFEPNILSVLPPKLEHLEINLLQDREYPLVEPKYFTSLPSTLTLLQLEEQSVRYRLISPSYSFDMVSYLPIECELITDNDMVNRVQAFFAEKKTLHIMNKESIDGLITNRDIYSYTDNDVEAFTVE